MNYDDTKQEIRRALDKLRTRHEQLAAASQETAKAAARPGTMVPSYKPLEVIGEKNSGYLEQYRHEALTAIEAALDSAQRRYEREVSAAPSAEATATIAALRNRTHITPEELGILLKQYGGNYQAAEAIADIAHDLGVNIPYASGKHGERIAEARRRARAAVFSSKPGGSFSAEIQSIEQALDNVDIFGAPLF